MRPLAAAALVSSLTLVLGAQAPKPKPETGKAAKPAKVNWDGEWTLVADESDKLDAAIESHVADLNFAMKVYWKKKLQNACTVWPNLDILAASSFTLTLGRERPVTLNPDGTATDWKRKDDEVFQASLRVDGPRMVQTLEAKDHTLSLAYSLRPEEDTLALQVTYTHAKLSNPFSYKLVYRRK